MEKDIKINLEAPWEVVKERMKESNIDLTDADLEYEPGKEDELGSFGIGVRMFERTGNLVIAHSPTTKFSLSIWQDSSPWNDPCYLCTPNR